MTHFLGIVTAWSAVAVLAWLAALLHPRLIPPAPDYVPARRWWQAGWMVAVGAAVALLQHLATRGWLLPDRIAFAGVANQLLIFLPVLIYLLSQRRLAAALIPKGGVLASLAFGATLALAALAAYLLAHDALGQLPDLATGMFTSAQLGRMTQFLLIDLSLASLLALLAGGWPQRTVMIVLALLVMAVIVLAALVMDDPLSELAGLLLVAAVSMALVTAVVHTRNVVWLMPPHLMIGLLLAVGD